MKKRPSRVLLVALGLVLAAGVSPSQATAADRSPSTPLAMPDYPVAPGHSEHDVSAVSTDDVWAVGAKVEHGAPTRTLVRHWDGKEWSHVRSRSPGEYNNTLSGVAAVSADDVWAVGYQSDSDDYTPHALVQHWNGDRWSRVTAEAFEGWVMLFSVSASGPDDVWAVGAGGSNGLLVTHWDGSAWAQVDAPRPPPTRDGWKVTSALLYDVTVLAPDDAWAVGLFDQQSESGGYDRLALAEHWDGNAWTATALPESDSVYIFDVSAASPTDVWAVGYLTEHESQSIVEHWDGHSWTRTSTSDGLAGSHTLHGVTALAPDDVWAVGDQRAWGVHQQTFIQHWDGATWTTVDSANRSRRPNSLGGVHALSADDVWAVGVGREGAKYRNLQEHWDGRAWRLRL